MKKYRLILNILAIVVALSFAMSHIAEAAWWNPASWFKKTTLPTNVQKTQPQIIVPTINIDKKQLPMQSKSTPAQKPPAKATVPQQVQRNKVELLEANKSLSNRVIIAKVKPAVVYIETESKSGSGMIIESTGYILTNAHVVSDASTANITLSDGRKFIATVVGRDENIDLALLKIDATNLPIVLLGDSNSIEQGDPVFALGYPLGIEGDVSFKDGTLSRRLLLDGITYLEISAQILPGNSGGPLVDEHGNVVGINTLAIGTKETLKFALPINVATNIIPQLKNGRNIVKDKIVTTPQNPSPQPQEDSSLKIARCQAMAQQEKDQDINTTIKLIPTIVANSVIGKIKGKLFTHLFDRPLNQQEISQLPQDIQSVINTGNRSAMEMQLKIINSQLIELEQKMTQTLLEEAQKNYNKEYLDCLNK